MHELVFALFIGAEIKNLSVWLVTTYEYSLLVIIVCNMYKLYILHNSIHTSCWLLAKYKFHTFYCNILLIYLPLYYYNIFCFCIHIMTCVTCVIYLDINEVCRVIKLVSNHWSSSLYKRIRIHLDFGGIKRAPNRIIYFPINFMFQ